MYVCPFVLKKKKNAKEINGKIGQDSSRVEKESLGPLADIQTINHTGHLRISQGNDDRVYNNLEEAE